uniref:Uncharacterized protein n=1 Tax=Arundo donax TaxID=35708 RepID=A0A0A9IC76_ARUDO
MILFCILSTYPFMLFSILHFVSFISIIFLATSTNFLCVLQGLVVSLPDLRIVIHYYCSSFSFLPSLNLGHGLYQWDITCQPPWSLLEDHVEEVHCMAFLNEQQGPVMLMT